MLYIKGESPDSEMGLLTVSDEQSLTSENFVCAL